MALQAFLSLTIDGNQVAGTSEVLQMGGVDVSTTIELQAVDHGMEVPEADGSRRRGRARHEPLIVTKRLDQSSPLLADALNRNSSVEGTLWFFRPNPDTGETEHFFTIEVAKGRITAIQLEMPDILMAESAPLPVREYVAITYQSITWRHELGNTEATVTVS